LHETRPNRITDGRKHNGDGGGCSFERLWCKRTPPRYKHIRLCPHKFFGHCGKSPGVSVGGSMLEVEVFSLDIAEVSQRSGELRGILTCIQREQPDTICFGLCVCRERPCTRCANNETKNSRRFMNASCTEQELS
jgi:hypothetical protein